MSKIKLVFLDAKTVGDDIDFSLLRDHGDLSTYANTPQELIYDRSKDAQIIITNKSAFTQRELLEKLTNTKLICITATGINNINLDVAKELGIAICNVDGYSTKSVAQHTFAMLFYVLEHLRVYDDYVREKKWIKSDTFAYLGKSFFEIAKKTWGIIGLGNIGKEVAKIAKAFGCNIIYYSTSGKNRSSDFKLVSLEELLKTSDIVSIHAPLDKKTDNLLRYKELSLMKKSSVLINVARGGIINEEDLAKAIDNEVISLACIDVLEDEPMKECSPYLKIKKRDKILITPHIAWGSIESRNNLIKEVFLNIKSFLDGGFRNRIV